LREGEIKENRTKERSRKRGRWWSSSGLVNTVKSGIPGIIYRSKWRRRQWRWRCWPIGKPWASQNQLPQLGNGDPLGRVVFKYTSENGVKLGGQRKDGPQKLRVLHVRPESSILKGCPLPWITTTGQVYQDNTQ